MTIRTNVLPGGTPQVSIDAATGNETYALPAGYAAGRRLIVRRVDSGATYTATVTVPTGGSIDGVTDGTVTIGADLEVTFEAGDGNAWQTTGSLKAIAAAVAARPELTATYARPYLPGGFVSGSAGTRRAQFAFGGGGATNNAIGSLTDAHERLLAVLPVATTRWRLRVRNAHADGVGIAGAFNINGVWFGRGARGSTGMPNGSFTAAPTQALTSFSTPADGATDTVTGWVTDPTLQFAANKLHLLSMGWTTSATTIARGTGVIFYTAGTGKSADASAATPSGIAAAGNVQLDVRLEYEFSGSQRVGIALGDSLTEGYSGGTTTIYNHATWHQLASQRLGIPVCSSAFYGSESSAWGTSTDWVYSRWAGSGLTIDFAVVQLGTNDLNSGQTLSTIQTRLTAVFAALRTLGVQDIYVNTIAPRALTTTPEGIRVALNSWLKSRPLDIIGVNDIAEALRDPTDATALRADYLLGGDTVHWSADGYHRAADAVKFA